MKNILLIGFIIVMMGISIYGIFILPRINKKKYAENEKEVKEFQLKLRKNDDVLTAIGIYGRIKEIDGNVISLQVDDGTVLKIDGSIIVGKTKKSVI